MTVTPITTAKSRWIANEKEAVRHVFIHDLLLDCHIGVHPHEQGKTQKVRLNLDLAVSESENSYEDELNSVVCYEDIANQVRALSSEGHINLVETFAEKIAAMCLLDRRVVTVRVRVEKLEALADAASVGVEIERSKHQA